ncbi:MAG: HK97 family phage prohead protease [Betaproteobacteria bacterium]|nr:HK97 family phage prohead protease [Betaproteobacteria bacterium]
MAETFRPPQGVRDEAARALAWIADGKAGPGFTDTGRARAAQLARGDAVSAETILRMYSFFARHEGDKQGQGFKVGDEGYPSPGRVAWAAWGGDAGFSWSSQIRKQLSARAALLEGESMESRDIEETETVSNLPEELTELLGTAVQFYFRAHGAHWNVKGADFSEYHKLFQKIYETAYELIDPIAENLRKIGVVAPATLTEFIALGYLQDSTVGQDPMALARDLRDANDVFLDQLSDVFDCASNYNQQGIANFIAGAIEGQQFYKWQLTASLGEEVTEPAVEPMDVETVYVDDVVVVEPVMEMNSADIEAEVVEQTETPEPRNENIDMESRKSRMASAERVTMDCEVRAIATDSTSLRIGGYAAQFNKEATGLSFREVIAPGAFTRTLQSGEPVFLLVNHDTDNLPLASTQSGTMALRQDETGLYMEADLDPNNPRAQELASAVSRGDVSKMSFAFTVEPGGDTREDGLRTLQDLNLFEVSVVTWPAYDATTVGMRTASAEDAEAEALELRKRMLDLKQKFSNSKNR